MCFEVTPAATVELSTFRAALQSVPISVCLLAYSQWIMRREWC